MSDSAQDRLAKAEAALAAARDGLAATFQLEQATFHRLLRLERAFVTLTEILQTSALRPKDLAAVECFYVTAREIRRDLADYERTKGGRG